MADALGLGVVLLVLARPAAALAAAAAHDHGRRRHALPLPDRGLVLRAPAAAAAAPRLVPRRLPRATRCCSTTFPFPFLVMSALAPVARDAGRVQARHRVAGVFLLPLLAYVVVPPDALRVSRRRSWARRRRSSSSTSRTPRSGAARSRARWRASSRTRTASASRCCSWACWCGRARTGGARGCPRRRSRSRPTPTATRCSGPGSRPQACCCSIRPARRSGGQASRLLAPGSAGLLAVARARVRARGARARAARRRLGLDDALRRRLDRRDDAGPRLPPLLQPLLVAAPARARARHSRSGPGAGSARRAPAAAGVRGAGRRGAGRGRAGAGRDRRALRAARPALAGARRRGRARRGRSGVSRSPTSRRSAWCCVAVVWADGHSRVLRHWVDWNYSGLETKELWPAWQELNARAARRRRRRRASRSSTAPSTSAPARSGCTRRCRFFSGRVDARGRLQPGGHHDAPRLLPRVGALRPLAQPVPQPPATRASTRRARSTRLRLFDVSEIVALSPELASALDARADVVREAQLPPYALYRLRDPGPGYVEPLAFAPVRADRRVVARRLLPLVLAQAGEPGAARVHATTRASTSLSRIRGLRRPSGRCRAACS